VGEGIIENSAEGGRGERAKRDFIPPTPRDGAEFSVRRPTVAGEKGRSKLRHRESGVEPQHSKTERAQRCCAFPPNKEASLGIFALNSIPLVL